MTTSLSARLECVPLDAARKGGSPVFVPRMIRVSVLIWESSRSYLEVAFEVVSVCRCGNRFSRLPAAVRPVDAYFRD